MVFHGSDQLPLGPHANLVLVHRLVDDRESDERGQLETLQADADLGSTLSNHANVRRGGDDFFDAECTLSDTLEGSGKLQTSDCWKRISVELNMQVRNAITGPK